MIVKKKVWMLSLALLICSCSPERTVKHSTIEGYKLISLNDSESEVNELTKILKGGTQDIYEIQDIYIAPDSSLVLGTNLETSWMLLRNNKGERIKIMFNSLMVPMMRGSTVEEGPIFSIGRKMRVYFNGQGELIYYVVLNNDGHSIL